MNGSGKILDEGGKPWGGPAGGEQKEQPQPQPWKFPKGWEPSDKTDVFCLEVYSGAERFFVFPELGSESGDLVGGGTMVRMGYIVVKSLTKEFEDKSEPKRIRDFVARGLPIVSMIVPQPEWWKKRETITEYYSPI